MLETRKCLMISMQSRIFHDRMLHTKHQTIRFISQSVDGFFMALIYWYLIYHGQVIFDICQFCYISRTLAMQNWKCDFLATNNIETIHEFDIECKENFFTQHQTQKSQRNYLLDLFNKQAHKRPFIDKKINFSL